MWMRVVLNWPAGDNRDFKLKDEGDCEGDIELDVFSKNRHPRKLHCTFCHQKS